MGQKSRTTSDGSRISGGGGGATTPKMDVKSYYLGIFSQKLHEIERILTPGARPWRPHLDPPMIASPQIPPNAPRVHTRVRLRQCK